MSPSRSSPPPNAPLSLRPGGQREVDPGGDGVTDPQTGRFLERYIQDAFHRYLKSSLTQAKMERLLDNEVLSSAEGDLMVAGPALCLYFAALRCTTNPPSVPLPRSRTSSKASRSGSPQPSLQLSEDNCPSSFISFLRVWSHAVPRIQSLTPELQHDLARVICGLTPLSLPPPTPTVSDTHTDGISRVEGIAADLRAVAIEISQRRSFQDRYASDLQAALDSGMGPANNSNGGTSASNTSNGTIDRKLRASFVPPPVYEPDPPPFPRTPSPPHTASTGPTRPSLLTAMPKSSSTFSTPGGSNPTSSVISPTSPPRSPANSFFFNDDNHQHHQQSRRQQHSPPPSPELLIIRETLYASLASVLETQSSLHTLLSTDPPRAYFASVSFAILNVIATCLSLPPSTSAVSEEKLTREATITGVLGTPLTLGTCPPELRPFFTELVGIGKDVRDVEREDTETAVRFVEGGISELEIPRMDEVRVMLEEGVGGGGGGGGGGEGAMSRRRSVRGRTVSLVNRINALSLGLTRLKAFRERQDEVFAILVAVGSTGSTK